MQPVVLSIHWEDWKHSSAILILDYYSGWSVYNLNYTELGTMKKVPKLDFCYLLGRSALEKGGSSSFQNHQWNRKSSHFFLFPLSRSLSYNRSSISFPWCSVICLCTLRMKKPFYADLARETNWVNIQEKERRSDPLILSFHFYS